MPFHAPGRRALLVLAALAAGLVAASPALGAFPAPSVTPDLGSPANGVHTKTTSVSFTIDPGINPADSSPYPFDWCFVKTGTAVTCSSPGGTTSPATATLPDGAWTLIAENGPDPSDNSFSATTTSFVIDTTGPNSPMPGPQTVEATSPSGALVQYSPTAFDAGDNHAVPVTCNPPAGSPQQFPLGLTTVNCSASDSLGNTTTGSFTVTVKDTTAPSIPALTSPADGAFLTTATPVLSWAASTDAVGVAGYLVYVDGTLVTPTPIAATSYAIQTPLGAGPHTWFVRAVDAANNASAPSPPKPPRSFTVGAVPAAPVVTGPPALTNDATPSFSWTADPGTTFVWAVFKGTTKVRGNTTLTPLSATNVAVQTPLGDGDYTFQVTAYNGFGASPASIAWPFTVDTTPPQLVTSGDPSIAPAPGDSNVGTTSPIELVFSEPVAPLNGSNVQLCVGLCGTGVDATVTSNGAKATLTPTAPLRGSTSYQVQLSGVTDLAGNALKLPSGFSWTFHTAQAVAPPDPATGLTLTPGVAQIGLNWTLPASGGLGKVRILRRDGAAPTGPADPAATAFDLAPTAQSYTDATATPQVHYFYAVYTYDAFGNPSATAATGDATALAPPEPVGPGTGNPGTGTVKTPLVKGLLNVKRLTPVKGLTVRSLRPVLKWKGIGKRAKLYNLQIFQGSRKVLSVFPRGTSYRVPKGKLKAGKLYVWRVWPYLGKTYTKSPVGVSFFLTAAKIQAEVKR